jgi:protein pelota
LEVRIFTHYLTPRRIQREGVTGTKDNTERKKITLTLSVEQVDFTPEDGQLRISGRNCEENKW